MNENKLISTKIEMTQHQMRCLKANKKANGLVISWQMREAIELYIKTKGLESLVQK